MMDGYDLDLIRGVSDAVGIPVIAAGGCGSYKHLAEVFHNTNAHAVAVGAAFQFMDVTPKGAARYLHEQGFQVRL
jgi:cyclase